MSDQIRILVIDDEEPIRRTLEMAFNRAGYAVDLAADGAVGVHQLRTERYDLVVTDFLMPKRSGMDVVGEVKKLRLRTPVLVLTGSVMEDEARVLSLLGASKLLMKPIELKDLYDAVDEAVKDSEQERRQAGRIPVDDRCVLEDGDSTEGNICCLSMKGCRIKFRDEISKAPDTATLSLKMFFPDGECAVTISPKYFINNDSGLSILGGEFVDLPEAEADQIKQRLTEAG